MEYPLLDSQIIELFMLLSSSVYLGIWSWPGYMYRLQIRKKFFAISIECNGNIKQCSKFCSCQIKSHSCCWATALHK